MKTILLTGANGFIGSNILNKLTENKEYNIIITLRKTSDTSKIRHIPKSLYTSFYTDISSLRLLFKINKIDGIIHCATKYGKNGEQISDILKSNIMLPVHLLEYAIENNVKFFMNMDSFFTKFECNYLNVYTESKVYLKTLMKKYSSKISIINVLLEHVYGIKDNNDKFIPTMINKIAIDKVGYVGLTPGEQKRDFIYIEDVVNVICLLTKKYLEEPTDFIEYSIGTGKSTSILKMVAMIKHLSESPTHLLFGELAYRENEIFDSFANLEEISKLQWTPKVDIETGLRLIMNNLKGEANEKK